MTNDPRSRPPTDDELRAAGVAPEVVRSRGKAAISYGSRGEVYLGLFLDAEQRDTVVPFRRAEEPQPAAQRESLTDRAKRILSRLPTGEPHDDGPKAA